MSTNRTPPNWAKDAVATVKGWANPKTGEILVSVKGLLDGAAEAPKKTVEAKKAPEPVEAPVAAPVPVEVAAPVEAPVVAPVEAAKPAAPKAHVHGKK